MGGRRIGVIKGFCENRTKRHEPDGFVVAC
jgi:hypothetical protein